MEPMSAGIASPVAEQAFANGSRADSGGGGGKPEIGEHFDGGDGAAGSAFGVREVVGGVQLPDVGDGPRRETAFGPVAGCGWFGAHEGNRSAPVLFCRRTATVLPDP